MKRRYKAMTLPVCLCGRRPEVHNRVRAHELPFSVIRFEERLDENGEMCGFFCLTKKKPLWLCGCGHCRIVGGGNTKREAVEAFRREVANNA